MANVEATPLACLSRGGATLEEKRGQQRQNAANNNPNIDKISSLNDAAEETKNEWGQRRQQQDKDKKMSAGAGLAQLWRREGCAPTGHLGGAR